MCCSIRQSGIGGRTDARSKRGGDGGNSKRPRGFGVKARRVRIARQANKSGGNCDSFLIPKTEGTMLLVGSIQMLRVVCCFFGLSVGFTFKLDGNLEGWLPMEALHNLGPHSRDRQR